MFRLRKLVKTHVYYGLGLKTFGPEVPDIYSRSVRWLDGTVSYLLNMVDYRNTVFTRGDVFTTIWIQNHLVPTPYAWPPEFAARISHFLCQVYANDTAGPQPGRTTVTRHTTLPAKAMSSGTLVTKTSGISINSNASFPANTRSMSYFVPCAKGHVTYDFLSCHPEAGCTAGGDVKECRTAGEAAWTTSTDVSGRPPGQAVTAMFVCEDGRGAVHHTLLCDFRPQCRDGSDEAFCRHTLHCQGFRCSSGQCVERARRCDMVRNCVDGTDEANCTLGTRMVYHRYSLPPPALVTFLYGGSLRYTAMSPTQACPDTHFRCPGEVDYCLPVYVRCNGVYDCVGHEDEADCDSYTCPDYYRCRASSVCVHLDHMCDGLPHCPQHDDELLCGLRDCPEFCQCQGLAFVCRPQFSVPRFPTPHSPDRLQDFPDLRYLDADGTRVFVYSLYRHHYLVWLSLRHCNLSSLPFPVLPNLRSLFLSHNRLTSVSMETFRTLPVLRLLSLEANPLGSVEARSLTGIEVLLLSHSQLQVFDGDQWRGLQQVRVLNLSFSRIHTVSSAGFRPLQTLVELDISGNLVKHYPTDLFKDNTRLERVHAENYRLCCEALLPAGFDLDSCFAPRDEVSSCKDLLQSDVYRLCLWAVSLLSILGNGACLVARLLLPGKNRLGHSVSVNATRSGYPIFVSSLGLADLLMGLYLAVIGAVDALHRGNYVWHEREWTSGGVCQLTGFLALLSSEVSALTICLITLDRFLVLRYPFSNIRFSRWSAKLASLVLWVLGAILAGLPLLPVTSHWQFYGQTGICIPLPITRQDFGGRHYAFGVMIVLNLLLFLLIAAGQAAIYASIRANAITTLSTVTVASDVTNNTMTTIDVTNAMTTDDITNITTDSTETAGSTMATAGDMADGIINTDSAMTTDTTMTTTVAMTTRDRRSSRELTIAHRLLSVALSDFLCWFPIGLLGVMASWGLPVPGEVNVAMAILVMPLNSALNPFLYTLNVLGKRWRKQRETQLAALIEIIVTSNKTRE